MVYLQVVELLFLDGREGCKAILVYLPYVYTVGASPRRATPLQQPYHPHRV